MLSPKRLAEIRRSLDLTQEGTARLLGVSFVSVNRWERGHSSPTGTVEEVYRALDLALKAGKSKQQILGSQPQDAGHTLRRIFNAAYGER